jgi:hypothetical protein
VRRLVTFAVAWLFAAGAATTAAWQGVALVTDQVTDDRPAALAGSDVQDRLDAGSPGSTPTSTTGPPAASSAPTTGPVQADPETRTYRLEGGTTTIQFSPSEVRATVVTPNPGFSVKTSEAEDTGWRVEFESDTHRSRLDAWWDGGPQARPREDAR